MMLTLAKWSFLLLVVSLPLVRPFNFSIFDLQVPYTDLIFLVSAAFWIVAVIKRETSVKTDRSFFFIGLYAIAFTVSTLISVDPATSFFKLLGEYYLFSLCFLTFNLVQDSKFLKRVVTAWLAGTAITIFASVMGFVLFYLGLKNAGNNYFLSHFGSLPAGDYPRIHALFANANMLCNFLNVSIMFALLAARLGWLSRVFTTIFVAGLMFAAFFSISPGLGGIALSVGLWYLATGSRSRIAKPVFVCGMVLAVAAFASTLISPDTDNTAQEVPLPFIERKFEPSVRVLVWQDTLKTVIQYPWFGKGTGIDVADVRYHVLSGMEQRLSDAHNMWLNVLGQTGLFGFTALMLMLGHFTTRCRFRINDGQYAQIAISCAFVGAFLYQGLNGSFEDARHLWVLLGLFTAITAKEFNASGNDISPASITP